MQSWKISNTFSFLLVCLNLQSALFLKDITPPRISSAVVYLCPINGIGKRWVHLVFHYRQFIWIGSEAPPLSDYSRFGIDWKNVLLVIQEKFYNFLIFKALYSILFIFDYFGVVDRWINSWFDDFHDWTPIGEDSVLVTLSQYLWLTLI